MDKQTDREQLPLHTEKVTSIWTELLFLALSALFLALWILRVARRGFDGWAIVFLILFGIFIFYSFNYRVPIIRITTSALILTFGIFRWIIPLDNIARAHLDELPALLKYGGAGIHFMTVNKRYRASFNLLEHPRVVIELAQKKGPVRDISFSTCQPDKTLSLLQRIALNVSKSGI